MNGYKIIINGKVVGPTKACHCGGKIVPLSPTSHWSCTQGRHHVFAAYECSRKDLNYCSEGWCKMCHKLAPVWRR